jgi:hypothetical protein
MTDTLTVRLSGMAQETETVNGYDINGFFVHHRITDNPYTKKMWTVSHAVSGMNLGAFFDKLKHAKSFAAAMATNYDASTDAQGLIDQFIARGSKPSVCDLAEQNKAISLF